MSSREKSLPNTVSDPDKKPPDKKSKTIPVLIQRPANNQSWALNYLQSIGLTHDKTIFKRKPKINSSTEDSNDILTKVSTASDINLANNLENVSYNNRGSTSTIHENGATFVHYNNLPAPTDVHATMPAMTYANLYVNNVNNYYSGQATGNSEFPISYYNAVTTPNTFINSNLVTTYPKTFDRSIYDVGNTTYYNSNDNDQFNGVNLPVTCSDLYCNQSNNYYEQNMWTPTDFCNIDKSLQNLTSGICENSTCNESNALRSQDILINPQFPSLNEIERNECCQCSCSKTEQEHRTEQEKEIGTTKNLEHLVQSKVRSNQNKLLDFLQKLNIKHHSGPENKSVEDTTKIKNQNLTDSQPENKSVEDITEIKNQILSDSQVQKQKHLQSAKTNDTDEEEPKRKKKKIEINLKDKTRKNAQENERENTINKKNIKQHDEKVSPTFKEKTVDRQDAAKRKRTAVKTQHGEETPPKFIKTKYVDAQEPTYTSSHKPVKSARVYDYDNKHCTKPDNNSIAIARIERKYESQTNLKRNLKDSSPKVKTSRLESTKYYMPNKPKNCYESNKKSQTSPVKSIVTVSKKSDFNKYSCLKSPKNKDLRNILSRKLIKKENVIKKGDEHEVPKKKCSDASSDNLIITVNNNLSKLQKSPEKLLDKSKSNSDSRKKLNLVINIVYQQPSSESNESDSDEQSPQAACDLSFLDEINVDEIVESLNKTEKNDNHTNSSDDPKIIQEDGIFIDKTNSSNERSRAGDSEIVKLKHVPNEDLLNNLIVKEASLLDSLRLVHQEIESEKRNLNNRYSNKKIEALKRELTLREEKNIELTTTVFTGVQKNTRPINEQLSIVSDTENNKTSMIPKNSQFQSQSLMLDACNQFEYIKTLETKEPTKQVKYFGCLDMNVEEISKQPYVQNKITNELVVLEDSDIEVEDLNQPIIDLSSDEEDKIQQITLKRTITKEQTLINLDAERISLNDEMKVSQNKHEITDTIDLTNCENESKLFENKSISPLLDENIIRNEGEPVNKEVLIGKTPEEVNTIENVTVATPICTKISNVESKVVCKQEDIVEQISTNAKINSVEKCKNTVETVQTVISQHLERESGTPKTLDNDCNVIKEIAKDNLSLKTLENVDNCERKLESMENEDDQTHLTDIALKPLSKDCNRTEVTENDINSESIHVRDDSICSENKLNIQVMEEKDHMGLLNVTKSLDTQETPEIQNVAMLNQNTKISEKTGEYKNVKSVKEKNGTDREPNHDVQTNEKDETNYTKNSNTNETNSVKVDESSKIDSDNYTVPKEPKEEKPSLLKEAPSTSTQKVGSKVETNYAKNSNTNETNSVKVNESSKTDSDNYSVPKEPKEEKPSLLKEAPSTSIQKVESKVTVEIKKTKEVNTVDIKKKIDDDKKAPLIGPVLGIATRIRREMLKSFNEIFKFVKLVHSGTHSKIFHFKDAVGRDYAVKSLNQSTSAYHKANQRDMLFKLQEAAMRSSYPCVFILNSFSLTCRLCYFTDYYPKNLKTALEEENAKPFHIKVVQHLARQLVSAVMLLKRHDIVHLEIQPSHILLNHTNTKLKLCGFDEAKKVNKLPLKQVGSLNYQAPEMIVGYKLGFDLNVWAAGLVLYEMATKIQLFPGTQSNDVLFKQMCTMGSMPVEMIHRSRFSHLHFTGTSFKRVLGFQNQISIITKFQRSGRIQYTIKNAYNVHWRSKASKQTAAEDLEMLVFFKDMLLEMLQINPVDRMPIQFVNAHPFITDERY